MNYVILCQCNAYSIPHPMGVAHCLVSDLAKPVCCQCGETCDIAYIDTGLGPYEYWGHRSLDREIKAMSACCLAPMQSAETGKQWRKK